MTLTRKANTVSKSAVSARAIDRRSKVMTLAWKCARKHSDMNFSQCLVWAWKNVKATYEITWSDGSKTVEPFLPMNTDLYKKIDAARMAKNRKNIARLQANAAAKKAAV